MCLSVRRQVPKQVRSTLVGQAVSPESDEATLAAMATVAKCASCVRYGAETR